MVVYGVTFDAGKVSKDELEEIQSYCTPENKLELVIDDNNEHAIFGAILDERSCLVPQPAREYSGDYGPTADMVKALINTSQHFDWMDNLAPDVYVFEPWTQP